MVPAYGIALILALVAVTSRNWHVPRALNIILSLTGLLLVAAALLLSYILPVFHLPQPSGKFAVGTTSLYFQDDQRPEIITPATNDHRELMVRAWYPAADEPHRATASYMHPMLAKAIIENRGLPAWVVAHFNLIKTHAWPEAAAASAQQKFPVIIFSPGYQSYSAMYTSLLEDLASHGYIVLSIDYTYETPLSIFPDGEMKFMDQEYVDVWKEVSWDTVQASIEAFRAAQEVALKRQYAEKYLSEVPYTSHVDHWVSDVSFIIDQLQYKEQLREVDWLDQLNVDQIGVMGHSLGGATSAVACATDRRIKAAINLDGSQWGSLMRHSITQPFLWITAEKDVKESAMDLDAFIYEQVTQGNLFHIGVTGATHTNFYDIALWSNYAPLIQTGSINAHRLIGLVNECTRSFFDEHLKNKPATIRKVTGNARELVWEP